MHFIINGSAVEVDFDLRTSLLDLLRDHVGLPGSKKGCNQGACGACTVLVDGERINACLALAVQYQGRDITTIEGLTTVATQATGATQAAEAAEKAEQAALHPLQAAFIEHDGFQCGYCTSGQICSAVAMVKELALGMPSVVTADLRAEMPLLTREELQERMSGNLCRCGAYNGIVDAITHTLVHHHGLEVV